MRADFNFYVVGIYEWMLLQKVQWPLTQRTHPVFGGRLTKMVYVGKSQ